MMLTPSNRTEQPAVSVGLATFLPIGKLEAYMPCTYDLTQDAQKPLWCNDMTDRR